MNSTVLCTLIATALSALVGCASSAPKVASAANVSNAELDTVKDPWKGQPYHMVVPAIAEGPAKIVGNTLLVSAAFFPAKFTDVPTFESCGQAFSEEMDAGWSCGVPVEDKNGDGWLEVDFSKAQPGVFDLSVRAVLRNRETIAVDEIEVWPSYRAHLNAFGPEAKNILRCTTTDIVAVCTLRVEVTSAGLVPAASRNIELERAEKAEAAAKVAKAAAEAAAEAAAKAAADEAATQEYGAVDLEVSPEDLQSIDETSVSTDGPQSALPARASEQAPIEDQLSSSLDEMLAYWLADNS